MSGAVMTQGLAIALTGVLVSPVAVAPPPAPPAIASAADLRHAYATTGAAMGAAGQPYAGWAGDGRQFLLFDRAGDGYAIEVVGELATADRIVILVPGTDNRLADFDRGLGGVARRAPSVQARTVHAGLQRAAGIGHGTRPSDPSFGARRLPAGVSGHDGYLVTGTETLAAIVAIVSAPTSRAATGA